MEQDNGQLPMPNKELRFQFGKNWGRFLRVVDAERVNGAIDSLREMLDMQDLRGQSFVDVGCGSGLFSLAAIRLGARPVRSFDYDHDSVASAKALRSRFSPDAAEWTVEQGSALDESYVRSLGAFDLVYSWGVLHHTGHMWRALGNTMELVRPGGRLFIAIYNDQGRTSQRWLRIKELYNRSPTLMRASLLVGVGAFFGLRGVLSRLRRWWTGTGAVQRRKGPGRGMSLWYDLVDWVGGYPFEVASPEEVTGFCSERGFKLIRMVTVGTGLGCNQFVFSKSDAPGSKSVAAERS